jgi:cytochrome c5
MKALKLLPLVIAIGLTACGEKKSAEAPAAPAATPQAAAAPTAPAPAAQVAVTASAGDLVKGEQVYNASCASCHGLAVMGAPKFGDKTAWEPRIAKGKDVLYTSAINGVKLMPPRGGNAALKDEDLKAAGDYMAAKAS